jgi:hypothetical protein
VTLIFTCQSPQNHSKRLSETSSIRWVLFNMSPDLLSASHTLDRVLSRGINIVDLNVFPRNPGLSDHHFITFAIATNNLLRPQPRLIKSYVINSLTTQRFLDALPDSLPKDIRIQQSVNHLTEEFNLTLSITLDAVAPLKTKNICHKNLAPWYTENTRTLKPASRNLERKWRYTKLEIFPIRLERQYCAVSKSPHCCSIILFFQLN